MAKHTPEELIKIAVDCFEAMGSPADEAKIVAEELVESNLMGLDSHGIIRLPQYVSLINSGNINPGGELKIVNDKGSTCMLDCGWNFGQVAGVKGMELAIERARKHGIACVITRRANHAGRLASFPEKAAAADMIGLATCNSPIHGHWVAPFGGREGRLATNPFSFAAPTEGEPIVFDISTAEISEGKVRVMKNKGQQVPEGKICDSRGVPTTDPEKFYSTPRGTILPFGGKSGYKGTALGLMVDILSGTLAGDLITDTTLGGNGLCLITINIANFVDPKLFRKNASAMADYIKSSSPAEGSSGVRMPGETKFSIRRKRLKEGIEVDDVSYEQIISAAKNLKTEKKIL